MILWYYQTEKQTFKMLITIHIFWIHILLLIWIGSAGLGY